MAVVKELIRTEENQSISFGNYELPQKSKVSDFAHQGDMYKVKTFKEITKLERNGMFVYESVPGTAVTNMAASENGVEFEVEGQEGSTIIDKVTRTVTVPLKETINLKEVVVKQCKVTEGVEAPLDSATVIDLSSPKKYTISLYQDYEWTIQASQTIERKLTIKNQFGIIAKGGADWGPWAQTIIGALLVVLAIFLVIEGWDTLFGKKKKAAAK